MLGGGSEFGVSAALVLEIEERSGVTDDIFFESGGIFELNLLGIGRERTRE